MTRESFDETPPRVEYAGTPATEALKTAFAHLYRWAGEHDVALSA